MTPTMQSMVAAAYVRDIGASRGFYELLGFREHSAGKAATSAWSSLRNGTQRVLLASSSPPLDVPSLPLLFYFFFDDIETVVKALGQAGVAFWRMGHPPHALGGEVKVLDPDGNTVLLGQPQRSPSQASSSEVAGAPGFSLLREAAALVAARGGASTTCQVKRPAGPRCRQRAKVKLADSAGDSAWACLDHAHEILLTVSGAFIASQDDEGIAGYLEHGTS